MNNPNDTTSCDDPSWDHLLDYEWPDTEDYPEPLIDFEISYHDGTVIDIQNQVYATEFDTSVINYDIKPLAVDRPTDGEIRVVGHDGTYIVKGSDPEYLYSELLDFVEYYTSTGDF